MEKQESKNRFPTFPQPRRLRSTFSYGIRIPGANSEFGQSNFDLLIDNEWAVEVKKSPNLSEYDRLFGQLARHLQHKPNVVALIMDAPSDDTWKNFSSLVDQYLNKDGRFVEV